MCANLFYLCGPAGSGKTTLGELLKKENPLIVTPELYSRNLKFHTEPNYRRFLKISGRAIENFEYAKTAKENPDKIILGNRCIYDCIVYNKVYHELGWLTKEEFEASQLLCSYLFAGNNSNPYAIILNPGEYVSKKHIEKRQFETGKIKWGEDNPDFIKKTCAEFEKLKYNSKILYIDHELDLKNGEIKKINEWMMGKYYFQEASTVKKEENPAELIAQYS